MNFRVVPLAVILIAIVRIIECFRLLPIGLDYGNTGDYDYMIMAIAQWGQNAYFRT